MAPPRLAWARLNVAVNSRTTTTSATSTTPSVVRASGPAARVSVRSASVTIGLFTVSVAAKSSATKTSARARDPCRNGIHDGRGAPPPLTARSTASALERQNPEDGAAAQAQVGHRSSAPASSADEAHGEPLHHAEVLQHPRRHDARDRRAQRQTGDRGSPPGGEARIVGQRAEGVGREQQDAEQEERPRRDDPLGRGPKRLEQHRAADQQRQDDQPADHALRRDRRIPASRTRRRPGSPQRRRLPAGDDLEQEHRQERRGQDQPRIEVGATWV